MTRASDVANILKQPFTNTLGTSNYRAGVNAGDAVASGGEKNVFVGDEAGTAITTSDKNVAIGFEALKTDTLGTASVAIGHGALSTQNHTSAAQTFNVAIGFDSGKSITTGTKNTLIGNETGDALTTGNTNVAVGNRALSTDTLGDHSVAIGDGALQTQNFTSSTDNYNIAIGSSAGNAITTGIQNTFIGGLAGDAQTVADNNTAVGFEALTTNTNGSGSVAIGFRALKVQNYSSATDSLNVAVGNNAGAAVTTGVQGVYIGALAGDADTTGGKNTYVGYNSGTANAGDQNVFIGHSAGSAITDGDKSTIIGKYDGNGSNLDIRTSDNNIVLSDGDGVPKMFHTTAYGTNGTFYIGNLTNSSYWPKVATSSGKNAVTFDGGAGQVGMTSDGTPMWMNRNNTDGDLIKFYAQGNNEGNISVSGTTVTYGGGHLGRWSQLSDSSKDTKIVKGTVMTNLDQMCVWKHEAIKVGDDEYNEVGELIGKATEAKDAYTEDNEQLNCMAVSNVEGDANVAGVFVKWDNDDDGFNDMMVAMTGDMVIRIAQGTKVARGDLLMSAGDGTAKPQGDDIVRSKTIAKVTSTNVSHTYDDGTYLVPCVLMAC